MFRSHGEKDRSEHGLTILITAIAYERGLIKYGR